MLRHLIFFFFSWIFANGINWHSSQIVLKKLYEIQNEQFIVIDDYLKMETARLRDLERNLIPIFDWYITNSLVKKTHIRNHINSFKCMTRIFNNLSKIRNLMNNDQSIEALKKLDEKKTISDLNILSAYQSIRRLQKVYEIPASDMAAGRYKAQTIGDQMDACECYVVSKYSFEAGETYSAIDWAIQTYNKWLVNRPKCVDVDQLHYFIKSASIPSGLNFEKLPDFRRVHHSENSEKFSQYFSLLSTNLHNREIRENSEVFGIYDKFEITDRSKKFRDLCKTGKSLRPLTNNSKCRYQTKNSFYRILMPFKEEDISYNPYMKLYHDFIFDDEIKAIISLSENDLMDASFYFDGKISLVEKKRLGQLKWFSESVDPELFGKLNERIETVTEFSTKTAEGFQTVNYGLGGHFDVHLDAFSDGPKLNGNRLVTVLFYLSDVYDNGYTVFPNLNFVAHCQKGTALVWQNLYLNNGTIHSGTYHGGCPILKGNKWIMTKGLYESGQNLTYDWQANKHLAII